jgi:hypothetical protein
MTPTSFPELRFLLPREYLIAAAPNLRLIVPLSIACFVVILAVPTAAARSRLHIPGYVGIALLALIVALACGKIAGIHGVTGTPIGVALSVIFFLLIAVTVGSVLALFFYRDPPEP